MIDGEIYVVEGFEGCVFAFRDDGTGRQTTHYIGVNQLGHVRRLGDGYTTGFMLTDGTAHPANPSQIERFTEHLRRCDYKWNKANKKVMRISTGELL